MCAAVVLMIVLFAEMAQRPVTAGAEAITNLGDVVTTYGFLPSGRNSSFAWSDAPRADTLASQAGMAVFPAG